MLSFKELYFSKQDYDYKKVKDWIHNHNVKIQYSFSKIRLKRLEYSRTDNWWNDHKIFVRNKTDVLSLKFTQL